MEPELPAGLLTYGSSSINWASPAVGPKLGGFSGVPQVPSIYPFQVLLFPKDPLFGLMGFVKIKEKRTFYLEAGKSCEFRWFGKKMLVDGQQIKLLPVGTEWAVPGHTEGWIFCHAGPCGTGTKAVATELNILASNHYRCKPVLEPMKNVVQTTNYIE